MSASCGVSRSGSVGDVLGGVQDVSSVYTSGVQDSHFAIHGRSGIQGSNVFYDDSCARLEACLNSRCRRGQEGAGGIKPRCTSTVSGVWRPAEEKFASPQPASGKLHVVGMGWQKSFPLGAFCGSGENSNVCCVGTPPSCSSFCFCATWARQ